jgi:FAD/FMN-containing dehydrogenase
MSSSINTDPEVRARYSQAAGIYRIVPAAVARPDGLLALREVIREAAARGWPIVPRGAGTGMAGGNVGSGLVIDLTGFRADDITVDPASASATVSASVIHAALQRAAQPHGLRLGADPSSSAWATIGGMVATNAAGARSYRTGAIDQAVMALTLETAAGSLHLERGRPPDSRHPVVDRWLRHGAAVLERHRRAVLERWPRTRKNTAGYGLGRYFRSGDLLDLVIGSEGTLGIVTDVTLRLEKIPQSRATLRIAVPSRALLPTAVAILADQYPTSIEMLDASYLALIPSAVLDSLPNAAGAVLLVDFEGSADPEVRQRADAVIQPLLDLGCGVNAAHDAATIEQLWSLRHGASPSLAALPGTQRSLQIIEDGCVPVGVLDEYLDGIESIGRKQGIALVMFGHAGDGHVHVNLLPDVSSGDWLDRVRLVYEAVTELTQRLGGTPAGEHGAGRLRAAVLPRLLGRAAIECLLAVKQSFDPTGRFNPGVIISDGDDPLDHLKVGVSAAILPDTAADWLAALESSAGWGTPRWELS